jgi:hypothetical protein
MFYKLEGKLRTGETPTVSCVVFENQIGPAITGLLRRDDVRVVEVRDASEREFMQYQRRKRKEG